MNPGADFSGGAELDPQVFKLKWKEAATVGLASFFFPFFGCAAAAHYLLGWDPMPSWPDWFPPQA